MSHKTRSNHNTIKSEIKRRFKTQSPKKQNMREGFVGVHIGAGQHAESRTDLYLSICAQACKVAVEELRKGSDALEAACKATMVLEDAGETNAGYGSNLTESGTVEMGKS